MLRRIVPISLWSFGAGLAVQFLLCGLYASSLVGGADLPLLVMLTLYVISETLLIGALLFFVVAVPAGSLLLRWLRKEEPMAYPFCAIALCLLLTTVFSEWTGHFDWRLIAFLLPAAFFFGGMWWNRIERERVSVA